MPKKMQWDELRRYWRRVYGYLLSPNPEPCVDIEFYRGKCYMMMPDGAVESVNIFKGAHLQYPLSTILVKKPVATEITDPKYRTEVCDAVIGQIKNGTLFGADLKIKPAENYLKPCLKNGLTNKKYHFEATSVK